MLQLSVWSFYHLYMALRSVLQLQGKDGLYSISTAVAALSMDGD